MQSWEWAGRAGIEAMVAGKEKCTRFGRERRFDPVGIELRDERKIKARPREGGPR
jgi:hypothetical protein